MNDSNMILIHLVGEIGLAILVLQAAILYFLIRKITRAVVQSRAAVQTCSAVMHAFMNQTQYLIVSSKDQWEESELEEPDEPNWWKHKEE